MIAPLFLFAAPAANDQTRFSMAVAKITEISSSSSTSFEDAIQQGISRASKTLENIKSAWVKDQQVQVESGKITEYRVTLKLTFVLRD